jgi:hypothetical protein
MRLLFIVIGGIKATFLRAAIRVSLTGLICVATGVLTSEKDVSETPPEWDMSRFVTALLVNL